MAGVAGEPAPAVKTLLDPAKPLFVLIVGRKGSGKSVLARRLFGTYPYDRLAIDPTHDVGPTLDKEGLEKITEPLPARWPTRVDEKRSTLLYQPDMGEADYLDNLDRAVGLGYQHGRCCIWVDEVGELTTGAKTPPWYRRVLHHGRHRDLTVLNCGPRPMDINPLVVSQSDFIYIFELRNPNDRKRLAENMGADPAELDEAVHGLPPHGYLRWDTGAGELVEFPPLPLNRPASGRA